MTLPITEPVSALDIARRQTHAFTALLRRVKDPSLNAIGEWSIGEVATHVGHIFAMYPDLVTGGSSPVADHLALGTTWDRMLAEDQERDPSVAADRIEEAFARFVDVVGPDNWTGIVKWHGGIKVPVYSLPSVLTSETTLHGLDVARAVGEPWSVDRDSAINVIVGHLPFLPSFANPETIAGMDAIFEVRLKGIVPVYFVVKDSEIEVQQEKVRADCKITSAPEEYLQVGYGRKGQWGPILTGKIVSWGRKPWLGLKFGKLFRGV